MGNVDAESLEKMNAYIEARNSPERRRIVEMVSQYVLSDLSPEEDKEEALVLSRYHLSTDKGTEDLKALYVDAISWLEEMQ
tara:strand:+ start:6394 stop:6636 length:243 start_codon:yes stop_codon:yes gene_type:complete